MVVYGDFLMVIIVGKSIFFNGDLWWFVYGPYSGKFIYLLWFMVFFLNGGYSRKIDLLWFMVILYGDYSRADFLESSWD